MEVNMATKLNQVIQYYGADTIWGKMRINGLTTEQINAMYNSLPAAYYTVDRTASGLVMGRHYANPFELPVVPGTDFDSNISGGSYGGGNTFTGNIPANLVVDPNTGLPVSQFSGPTTSGGSVLPAVADRISLAVAGVNIGAKLGLKIDEALYQTDPQWWNENLPTVNPQTWSNLVGVNPIGDFFLRVLFGITGNTMTGYISTDTLAYYYQLLRDSGAWDNAGKEIIPDYEALDGKLQYTWTNININMPQIGFYRSDLIPDNRIELNTFSGDNVTWLTVCNSNTNNGITTIAFSKTKNATATVTKLYPSDGHTEIRNYQVSSVVPNTDWYYVPYDSNNTVTYINSINDLIGLSGSIDFIVGDSNSLMKVNTAPNTGAVYHDIAVILDNSTIKEKQAIPGISGFPNSTAYPPTNITGSTPSQVKQQLQQQYPDLFQDSITEATLQDDGTVTETTYVPIPWVTTGVDGEEKTTDEGKTQDTTQVDEETSQQVLPQTQPGEPTDPPDTGDGSTPVPAVPTGSASSLWAVYNPTQAQLNSFGAWLWSSDFVEQLKKLFADPMQAIIGVHKVFATPSTGGSQTIKCGYLDSGVSSAVVTNQYTTVDCGSASLREYFGNVFDYDPFTKVSIFLPFIGIVPLNTADVMRSTISVKYKVDVITGACLAEVSVSRDGGGGILYTYGGSAIVTYPVSSGSYVGAVQAALSTAIGIGSAIATGGASLGASAGMVLGGLSHAKTQVQHSGQFSGSSGAMGGKKPYLIVSRPQTRVPQKISEYEGIPSNSIHPLSECSGFTKVKEVHIISKTAYDNEIQEIENLLKTGVII